MKQEKEIIKNEYYDTPQATWKPEEKEGEEGGKRKTRFFPEG